VTSKLADSYLIKGLLNIDNDTGRRRNYQVIQFNSRNIQWTGGRTCARKGIASISVRRHKSWESPGSVISAIESNPLGSSHIKVVSKNPREFNSYKRFEGISSTSPGDENGFFAAKREWIQTGRIALVVAHERGNYSASCVAFHFM